MDVIVVASSESGIQETLRILLGEGHVLIPARTPAELMNALVEHPVDVAILDEFLESTDCATVYRRLRSISPDVTCIMLALHADSETAHEMNGKGIYDIISKPFDKDDLLASIRRALERARLMQRLAVAEPDRTQTPETSSSAAAISGDSPIVRQREMFDSLRKFLKAITGVLEPGRFYEMVLEAIVEMFAINRATLLLQDEKTQQMGICATVGLSSNLLRDFGTVPWANITAWLRKHDQILYFDVPGAHAHSQETIAIRKELELLQSHMCVPLIAEGRLVGALALGKKVTGKRLSDDESEFLCLLAQQVATIIENAKLHRDVFVQKEKFEEILQGVNSGLFATDSEGRLLVFNKAAEQILGLKASEVIGKSVQRIGSAFADIVFKSLREEKSLCRHELVDPATKTVLGVSTSLLTDAGGMPIGAVALFTDLSTVSSRATGAADESWQRCALCLAHEIKNPLVAIRTFAQLFPESYDDEKFREEFSEIAMKEIDKLDGVVERLLRFARPLELRAGIDDIHSLLEEEMARIANTAKERNVEFEKDFRFSNGNVSFDRDLMREAFEQVLNNALEAMPSGGKLSVSTAESIYPDPNGTQSEDGIPPGRIVEIRIADTGAGIPSEEMPNLFKPFYTSKLKGMGLGLPMSRRIIREHSGDIMVSSKQNQGTTVKIILPHGAP